MSSGVILLQRPYISFSSPLLLILRREITAAAVALFYLRLEFPDMELRLDLDIFKFEIYKFQVNPWIKIPICKTGITAVSQLILVWHYFGRY